MKNSYLTVAVLLGGCQFSSFAPFNASIPGTNSVSVQAAGPSTASNGAGITINPAYLTLAPGGKRALIPAVKLKDGQINQNVVWTSSDNTIAEVNTTTGEVSALKEGWVTIVASYALDPSVKEIVTVHVVKDLEVRSASRYGIGLKYPSYWKISVVDSERRDAKTIFQLVKSGPNGTAASMEVFVASGAYYDAFVAEIKKLPIDNPKAVGTASTIVAGNKDGYGAALAIKENAVDFKSLTWVVRANGYAYLVKAAAIVSGDGSLETRDELQAILDSLIFSSPAGPIDLDSPQQVNASQVAKVQQGVGGLVAEAPMPNPSPAQADLKTPSPSTIPVSSPTPTPPASNPVTSTPIPAIPIPSPTPLRTPSPGPTPTPVMSTAPDMVMREFVVSANPYGLVIDKHNVVWAVHNGSTKVTRISNDGNDIRTIDLGNTVYSISIDRNGAVWVSQFLAGKLTKLDANGAVLATYNVPGGVTQLVFDSSNTAWTRNTTKIIKLGPDAIINGSYQAGESPSHVLMDQAGTVWVVNSYFLEMRKLSTAGEVVGTYKLGFNVRDVVIDPAGTFWFENASSGGLNRLPSPGASPAPVIGTYMGYVIGVAYDPVGCMWASTGATFEPNANALMKLSLAGGVLKRYALPFIPSRPAIDSAGNIWVSRYNDGKIVKITPL